MWILEYLNYIGIGLIVIGAIVFLKTIGISVTKLPWIGEIFDFKISRAKRTKMKLRFISTGLILVGIVIFGYSYSQPKFKEDTGYSSWTGHWEIPENDVLKFSTSCYIDFQPIKTGILGVVLDLNKTERAYFTEIKDDPNSSVLNGVISMKLDSKHFPFQAKLHTDERTFTCFYKEDNGEEKSFECQKKIN
jgi:hypothetical protein